MSLNFSLTKIENWKEVCRVPDPTPDDPDNTRLSVITETLVFHMMNTGLGWELTSKNAAEFYARIGILESLYGASYYERIHPDEDELVECKITPEQVYQHIGLSVNVSPESRAAFIKRHVGARMDMSMRGYNSYVRTTEDSNV